MRQRGVKWLCLIAHSMVAELISKSNLTLSRFYFISAMQIYLPCSYTYSNNLCKYKWTLLFTHINKYIHTFLVSLLTDEMGWYFSVKVMKELKRRYLVSDPWIRAKKWYLHDWILHISPHPLRRFGLSKTMFKN